MRVPIARTAAWLVLLLLAAACVKSPASGRHAAAAISEPEELQIGAEADRRLREENGVYTEKQGLQAYVASVGGRVAAVSGRSGIPWRFEVLDTSDVNAFAVPGGYVYVTRGLLTQLNSEDELAAALAHEIAHVAKRHGSAQLGRAREAYAQTLAGRGSAEGPAVDPGTAVATIAHLAEAAVDFTKHGYAREEEREADGLGPSYALAAGYNPRGTVDLLETLGRVRGEDPALAEAWMAAHPTTEGRLRDAPRMLDELRRGDPAALARPIRRQEYVSKLEGVAYGASNGAGYVSGRWYVGKRHAYAIQIPDGWTATLKGADVTLARASEGLRAEMRIEQMVRASLSSEAAIEFARKAGTQGIEILGPVEGAQLPAGDAAIVRMRGRDPQGVTVIGRRTYLVRFDKAYVLTLIVPEERADDTEPIFQALAGSIRLLKPDEDANYPAPRLAVSQVAAGDTWGSIASARLGDRAHAPALARLNGASPDSPLEPGQVVKVPPRGGRP